MKRFARDMAYLVLGLVLGGALAASASMVANPGWEDGTGTDADEWTESIARRVSDLSLCRDGSACARLDRLNLRNQGGDGQEGVNPCTANNQRPAPDWTEGSGGDIRCANTDVVAGTYRFAVVAGFGYQTLGTLRQGYTYTVSVYAWNTVASTASLIVSTTAGGGGTEYCNQSTTTTTKPSSPNLTCDITPSSDTATVYLALKTTAGSRFDEVAITPISALTSTAVSVGSYTHVTASALFRGGGGTRDWGRIELLDQTGTLISGCMAESQPMVADWTNRVTVASCSVGSATSVSMRVRSINATVYVETAWMTLQSSALAAPTSVTVSDPGLGGDSVWVTFNSATSTGATQHRLYRSATSGSGYSLVGTITDLKREWWIDTGLTAGTPYYYVMRTFDGSTESGNSAEVAITPNYPIASKGTTIQTGIAGRMMQVDPYISDTSQQEHGVTGGYPDFGGSGTDVETVKTRLLEAKPVFTRTWLALEHVVAYTVPNWTLSGTSDDRTIDNGDAESCTSDTQSPPPNWSQASANQIYCSTTDPVYGTYRFSVANGGYGYQSLGVLTGGQSYTFQVWAWNQTSATAAMKVSTNSDGTGTVYCETSTTTTTKPTRPNLLCTVLPASTTATVYLVLSSTGGTGVSRFDLVSHDTFRPEPWIYNNADGVSAVAMTVPSGIWYLRVPYGHLATQAVTLAASTEYTIAIKYMLPKTGATAKVSLETTAGGVGAGNTTRCSNTGTAVGGTTFTTLSCLYTTGGSPETAYVTLSCLTDAQCWFDDAAVTPTPTGNLSNGNFDSSTMAFDSSKLYTPPGHMRATNYATIYDQWIDYLRDNAVDVLLVVANQRTGSTPTFAYHGWAPSQSAWYALNDVLIDALEWLITTRGLTNVKYVTLGNELDSAAGWITPSFEADIVSDLRTDLDTAGFTTIQIFDQSDNGSSGTFSALTTKWSNSTLKSTLDLFAVTMYGDLDASGSGPLRVLWEQKGHREAYDAVSNPKPRLATFELGVTAGDPYNPLTIGQGVDDLGTLILARALVYGLTLAYDAISYWMGPNEATIGETLSGTGHVIRWGGLMYKDAASFYGGGAAAWDRKASWQLIRTYGAVSGNADVATVAAGANGSSAYPHLGVYATKGGTNSVIAYQDFLTATYWPINTGDATTIADNGQYGLTLAKSGTPSFFSTGGWDNGAYYSFGASQKLTLTVPTHRLPIFWLKQSFAYGCAIKASAAPSAGSAFEVLPGSTAALGFVVGATGNRVRVTMRDQSVGAVDILDADSTTALWDNAWHSLVVTYNGRSLVLYLDGVPTHYADKSVTLYESPAVDAPETTVINVGTNGVAMDDCFVSRYLTPSQVADLDTDQKFATFVASAAAPSVRFGDLGSSVTKRQWLYSSPTTYSEAAVSSSGGYVTVSLPYGSNTVLDGLSGGSLWWWGDYYR